jgi:ankyrin repeat protein
LHWAAKEGHPEAAAALLIAGADIHAIDRKVLGIQVYKPCVHVQSLLQWIDNFFCLQGHSDWMHYVLYSLNCLQSQALHQISKALTFL